MRMLEFPTFSRFQKPKQGIKSLCCLVEANAALLVTLILAGRAFSDLPVWISAWFWTTVPVVLFPLWLLEHWKRWDTFLWMKTVSLMPMATLWATACRLGAVQSMTLGRGSDRSVHEANAHVSQGCFLVLSINILEAGFKDVFFPSRDSKKAVRSLRFLNGISALLLIIAERPSLPFIELTRGADKSYSYSYILWPLGGPWVFGKWHVPLVGGSQYSRQSCLVTELTVSSFLPLAYTVWNIVFVQHNYPYSLGRHIMVLMAPILLCIQPDCTWNSSTWAQHRGHTLAFYFILRNTAYDKLRALTDVDTRQFGYLFELLSFVLILGALIWQNARV